MNESDSALNDTLAYFCRFHDTQELVMHLVLIKCNKKEFNVQLGSQGFTVW